MVEEVQLISILAPIFCAGAKVGFLSKWLTLQSGEEKYNEIREPRKRNTYIDND